MAHQSFGEWDYEITDPLPYYDLPPIIAESILKDSFE